MRLTRLLVLALFLFPTVLAQDTATINAIRVRRFVSRASNFDAITEANYELTRIARRPDDIAVVRICSKESMALALSTAAASPFIVAKALNEGYNFSFDLILFLRSEDCGDPSSKIAVTELWAVPRGAALPPFVESITSGQARKESIGSGKAAPFDGVRNYKTAAQELITKLESRPHALGIVQGYYYRKPSPAMRRRLHEVEKLLQLSKLPKHRYVISLIPWSVEHSIGRPQLEPPYPSISILEILPGNVER